MTYRHLGIGLIVALAALLAVGGAAGHGGTGPVAGPPTGDGWWMGSHMGNGPMGYGPGAAGSVCDATWAGGMMGGYDRMMGGSGGWGMGGSGVWGLGFLWPLLLLGLVIVGGYVLLVRTGTGREDRALQLLRERYAAGELSADEYATQLERLNG